MRLDIETGGPRRLRLWFGDLPPVRAEAVEEAVRSVDVATNVPEDRSPRAAAVEVYTLSGKSDYALVGGMYTPGSSGLTVRVAIASLGGPLFLDTINIWPTTTHIGLPAEYIEGVFEPALGSGLAGDMRLDRAAHCEAGSSIVMFRLATRLLCHCFDLASLDDTATLTEVMVETIRTRHEPFWPGVAR